MQLDSTNAKHKLFFVALVLLAFAIPFAWQWHGLNLSNTKAVLAGGGVIGSAASAEASAPSTNHVGHATNGAGRSFTGALAR